MSTPNICNCQTVPSGTCPFHPSDPVPPKPEDVTRHYGFYENTHYGSSKRNYLFIIRCSAQQAEIVTDKLNRNRGGLWNGTPSGSMGTPNYFSYEPAPHIFESHDEFRLFIAEKEKEERENTITRNVWSNLR